MKILLTTALAFCFLTGVHAQTDSVPFRAHLYNKEYKVYMHINFHRQDVAVPGQELYGLLPGYLGKDRYSFCWPIIAAEVKGKKAVITMVNDYGSEDLTATLTQEDDTTYVLKQQSGSPLKMPDNGKWQKLPKTITFHRSPSTIGK